MARRDSDSTAGRFIVAGVAGLAAILAAVLPLYLKERSTQISQVGQLEFQLIDSSDSALNFQPDHRVNLGNQPVKGWWVSRRDVQLEASLCRERPTVVVALAGFDLGSWPEFPIRGSVNATATDKYPHANPIDEATVGNARVLVDAESITKEGFKIALRTWADTRVYWVKVQWLAVCARN
jgi:hypothetical protein